MSETITVGENEYSAAAVEEALDRLPDEPKDEAVVVDGVVVAGDGWSDSDVRIAPLDDVTFVYGATVEGEMSYTNVGTLREKVSDDNDFVEYVEDISGLSSLNTVESDGDGGAEVRYSSFYEGEVDALVEDDGVAVEGVNTTEDGVIRISLRDER